MNTDNQLVVYLGPFAFPNGGAAARRILGISKSLQAVGYKVKIGSGQESIDGLTSMEYEGIEVHSLNERTAENYPTLLKYMAYLTIGKKTIAWLNSLEKKPDAIILYSGYSPYLMKLLPWCKSKNVPLIFDAVEWYDPPSKLQGILNPYYWNIEFAMKVLNPRCGNIVAISRYLYEYYKSKGCNTILLPPTLDTCKVDVRTNSIGFSKVNLCYTGNPGHKDLLDNILEALLQIDLKSRTFLLHIAGISDEQLLSFPALRKRMFSRIPECIKCYGIVSQEQAMDIVRKADFSVLLRPNKRYAKAGFPTKFVESFSVGTPVIANHTSDLAKYLKDEVTGLVCENESVESMYKGLSRIRNLDKTQIYKMRVNARATSLANFSYESTNDAIYSFMSRLKK